MGGGGGGRLLGAVVHRTLCTLLEPEELLCLLFASLFLSTTGITYVLPLCLMMSDGGMELCELFVPVGEKELIFSCEERLQGEEGDGLSVP